MSDDDEQASVPSADESDDFASDASDSSKKKKSKPASKAPAKKAPAKPKTATAPKKPSEPKKPKKEPSSSVKPPKEASAGSLKAKASAAVTSASVNVSSDDITKGANVTTEAGAKKLISAYLHLQNRPYSAIQVFDNLHKRVPKGTTEKVLQSLADETDSGVRCKEFGKLKVFWSEQANLNLASLYTPEQMEALEERVEELKGEREAGAKREKTLMAELATLTEMPADEDLVRCVCRPITRVIGRKTMTLSRNPVHGLWPE